MPEINCDAKQHLILVGGGHAHAQVIKLWAKRPIENTSVSVISPNPLTPYSGMLPGLIAGHYDFEDIHIDLEKLCRHAAVNFIEASVKAIDLKKKTLTTETSEITFDLISINSGITPDMSVPGTPEFRYCCYRFVRSC